RRNRDSGSQALSDRRRHRDPAARAHEERRMSNVAGSVQFLAALENVIAERLADAPEGSYTAKLAAKGIVKVAQKVGEEGLELALAAAAQDRERVTAEA